MALSITFFQFISLFIVTLTTLIVLYFKWAFKYRAPNVPTVLPPRIPFGHLPNPFTIFQNPGIDIKYSHILGRLAGHKIVKNFNFATPWYLLVDPQYIKYVIQNDFDHFVDRGFYYNEKDDPLSANLFAIGGEKWSFVRTKLSPTFTSGKLKGMFKTLLQCANQLQEAVSKIADQKQSTDVYDLAVSYSINVIGSCAFGIECNCFKNPNAEFKKQGKEIFHFNFFRTLKVYLGFGFPNFARKLKTKLFSKETTNFFVNLVKEVVQFRLENGVKKKDMMQLLMEVYNEEKEKTSNEKKVWTQLNFEEITSQAFVFFAAGFETTSITLTYCLFELSRNEEVQNKLREEIITVLQANDGNVTYDMMLEMKYMTQVIDETLRKYPPVMYLFRKCVKDYRIPDTDIHIAKGEMIIYSVLGLHHDPESYPEPNTFDPERFSVENKSKIEPFTYLPFGEGPRICIGLRFAMMQLKVALTLLLSKYKLSLNDKTKLPLKCEVYSFTLIPSQKIYLNIDRLTPKKV